MSPVGSPSGPHVPLAVCNVISTGAGLSHVGSIAVAAPTAVGVGVAVPMVITGLGVGVAVIPGAGVGVGVCVGDGVTSRILTLLLQTHPFSPCAVFTW